MKNVPPDLGPTELMIAMGAPSWNPIPPDQTKWQSRYKVPLFRLWGFMCEHSIRKGRRKGYVCDNNGNPLSIEDAARSLQMDPGFCRRLFREGIAMGLWRRGLKGESTPKIILNGRVSKPAFIEPRDRISDDDIPLENEGGHDGEQTEKPSKKKVCTLPELPPYILMKVNELPQNRQKSFFTLYSREVQGEKDMHADLTAANRLLWAPRKDGVLKKFGIDKIREVHSTKDGKPREPRPPEREQFIQEVLPGLEEHIKGYVLVGNGRSVQSQNHSVKATSIGPVQTFKNGTKNVSTRTPVGRSESGNERALLEPLESSLSTPHRNIPAAAAVLSKDKPAAAASLIAESLNVDLEAASAILKGCRAVDGTVTAPEIVQLGYLKLASAKEQLRKGKIANPTGLLIKHLPTMCQGPELQQARQMVEQEARERAQRVANAREAWPELNSDERAEVLRKYPELQEKSKGASGDD